MSEEEMANLWSQYFNNYISPILNSIDIKIEKIRDEFKSEHEDLRIRAINAETKLAMYEGLFGKLNLNVELKK